MAEKIKNKELKFRFNFIDAIVILLIAALIGALIYLTSSEGSSVVSGGSTTIEYTVELRNIRDEFKGESFIKEGDSVTDSVTLYSIGNVISVSYSPSSYTSSNSAGEVVSSEYINHTNITVTIRATADTSGGAYDIGGYTVAVGKAMGIRLPNFCAEGYCTGISEVTE